jgi:hypothetical protein
MHARRLLMLLAAMTVFTGAIAEDSDILDSSTTNKPTDMYPATKSDSPSLGARFSSSALGLKAPSVRVANDIELPFGMNFSRDTRSLLLQLNPKSDWGIGLNLDVNASRAVELAPSTPLLGLQPKRTPGLMLQKRF